MGVIVSLNMSVSGGECECGYDYGVIVSEDKNVDKSQYSHPHVDPKIQDTVTSVLVCFTGRVRVREGREQTRCRRRSQDKSARVTDDNIPRYCYRVLCVIIISPHGVGGLKYERTHICTHITKKKGI